MSEPRARLTFHVSVASTASPQAIYDQLADPGTHLVWAGERAPRTDFRLLTMDAASRPAAVGDGFSSTGANGKMTFHDRSVVVEAVPGSRFGFDTESTLERPRAETWHARFAHRYAIEPSANGSVISYTCRVWPQNYVPYWLKRGMRPMTRLMVQRMMRKNLENLATMAAAPLENRT